MRALGVAALAVALAPATHARAVELWRAETFSVEGSGFYKPAATAVLLPADLVTATTELQRVFDETRALLPPDAAADLPANIALPAGAALLTQTLRLQATARLGDELALDVAWQPVLVVATDPRFAATSNAGALFGGSASTAQRRLIDFDPVLFDGGNVVIAHNIDKLALSWQTAAISVIAGRQVVSWGTGHLWNPTDLFSPFAPTDVDREVRRGADALRIRVPLSAVTEVDALWLPQAAAADNGAVLRARSNVFDVDVSVTAAKYVGDVVLGADFATDVGRLGVYGEGAWTLSLDGRESFGRAVAGFEARPTEQWVVVVEGYYNGFGATEPPEIVGKLTSARMERGEVFGARRFYVGAVSALTLGDLVTVSATTLLNIDDPSILFAPSLEWSVTQSVLLRGGLSLPLGAGVDAAELRALTARDVLLDSPAFERATTTLGARSETGLNPAAAFVQLGVYFG